MPRTRRKEHLKEGSAARFRFQTQVVKRGEPGMEVFANRSHIEVAKDDIYYLRSKDRIRAGRVVDRTTGEVVFKWGSTGVGC